MDERNVRSAAGPHGEGRTHRVGLTRHCLASGLVQLPFALRDALPEGALLAQDVERDTSIDVTFAPPRALTGLHDFFTAYELQVNDEIEIRVVLGDPPSLRIRPVVRAPRAGADSEAKSARSAPSDRAEETGSRRQASIWRSYREEPVAGEEPRQLTPSQTTKPPSPRAGTPAAGVRRGAPHERPADLTPPEVDVVDRFGSVTVRRLGAGGFSEVTTAALTKPDRSAGPPASAPTAPRRVDPVAADNEVEPMLGIDPDLPWIDEGDEEVEDLLVAGTDEADDETLTVTDDAPSAAHAATTPTPQPTPARASSRATDPAGEVRQVSLFDGPAPAAPATSLPPMRPAARRPSAPRTVAGRRNSPARLSVRDAVPAPSDEARPNATQRAREEELSRAGDLRSRIVRWLLAPSTPVIVSLEAVQSAFDLPPEVARDIVDGIIEAPPPSLVLTQVREDLLRVSRMTVEQSR